MSRIELETTIDASPDRCFDLSLSVDVHMASMAHTSERAVAGVTTGAMRLGDTVTWEARHLGRSRRLTTRISGYDRPRWFRDEQVTGPFRHFAHDHFFSGTGAGTLMPDAVEFAWFGPFDRVVLAPYVRSLLRKRNETIKLAAESG